MNIIPLRRREFINLLGGAAVAWPLAARAQQTARLLRVSVLVTGVESDPEQQVQIAAFREGLRKLGWVAGQNVQIDYRWGIAGVEATAGAGAAAAAAAAAADVLSLAPDVVVAYGSSLTRALQQLTRTIPIVFVSINEPVAQGFVQSLARPGGNITGFTALEPTIGGKWLELLKEIAPGIARVAILFSPDNTGSALLARSAAQAAPKFAVDLMNGEVRQPAEIDHVITTLGRETGGGLIVPTGIFTTFHRSLIIELASRYRVPAIYAYRFFVAEGGLASYGVDVDALFRSTAGYVARILRGEKPADLPVQQPVKFELVINMKTAKALGLTVPLTLQVAADEVVE